MNEGKFYTVDGGWFGTRIMASNENGDQHLIEEQMVDLLNDFAEENQRLRAALEKFADRENWWRMEDTDIGGRYQGWDPIERYRGEPWEIAQQALKGREGRDAEGGSTKT